MIVDRRSLMMGAVRTSETSVDNHFTRQYIPEDNSEHHTRRRENLSSNIENFMKSINQSTPNCIFTFIPSGNRAS
jgi:hypothetical protein